MWWGRRARIGGARPAGDLHAARMGAREATSLSRTSAQYGLVLGDTLQAAGHVPSAIAE